MVCFFGRIVSGLSEIRPTVGGAVSREAGL